MMVLSLFTGEGKDNGHLLICQTQQGNSTSLFIPTIINELGYTAEKAQIRSIPIFMVATVVSLSTAWSTDRLKHRYSFIIAGTAISITGYIILLCQKSLSVEVKYFGCFLITSG